MKQAVLRVGIVGAGPMGRLHARTISRSANADAACALAMIMDHHRGRAETMADEFGAAATDSLPDLLSKVDAVVLCTPTSTHAALASIILEDNRDLLIEKPLAATLGEGQMLAALAARTDRVLQVGHVEWYNPGWRAAVESAGAPETIEVERLNPTSERGLDIDVVSDFMLHDLDWVTRLLDEEIVELEASGSCLVHDRLDEAEAKLVFRSGCRATLRASRVHPERRRVVRIVGANGSATADLLTGRRTEPGVLEAARTDPLAAQWADFMDSVRRRTPPPADAAVGVAALELVDRVHEAIALADARGDDLQPVEPPRSSNREDGSALGR